MIGLKVLSVRVRELVFEKQTTTYKEVADDLIQELIREGKMTSDKKNVFLI
jgi:polyhydroxyalkanoate synthesis regulator phasin